MKGSGPAIGMASHFTGGVIRPSIALSIALLASLTGSGVEAAPTTSPPPACDREIAVVAVVDDELGVLPSVAEQYLQLKLPALASIARRVVDANACLGLWEASTFGAPSRPPDVVLRVRATQVALLERSLTEKAESALTRYLSTYLGGAKDESPLVERAKVTVSIQCPGRKGFRAEAAGEDQGGFEGEPVLGHKLEHPMDVNAERFARALRQATDGIVERMRAEPRMCAREPP